MNRMTDSRFSQILAAGVLIAVLSIGTLAAAEPEHHSITDKELWRQRPANMFKMSENNNPSVCKPLLASLNTSMRIASPPARSLFDPNRKVSKPKPFPLLRNKFIIDPWKVQKYRWRMPGQNKQTTLSWEAAYLDFDGDGAKDGLIRQRNMDGGNEYHFIWFVTAANDRLTSENLLDEVIVKEIITKHIFTFKNFDRPPHHNRQFIEVVEINGQRYFLISRAFYWTLKNEDRFPRVQLIKRTSESIVRVCLFEGRILIIGEN